MTLRHLHRLRRSILRLYFQQFAIQHWRSTSFIRHRPRKDHEAIGRLAKKPRRRRGRGVFSFLIAGNTTSLQDEEQGVLGGWSLYFLFLRRNSLFYLGSVRIDGTSEYALPAQNSTGETKTGIGRTNDIIITKGREAFVSVAKNSRVAFLHYYCSFA